LGEKRVEMFALCVPRPSTKTIRLRATGSGFYGAVPPDIEGLPIGVKVASIEVADDPRPCN
jgi:hypothetical protein